MQEGSGYGRFVAGKRSKWVTLLVWIIIAVVLGMVWPAVGDRETNNAQDLSDSKPSVQAAALAKKNSLAVRAYQHLSSGVTLRALLMIRYNRFRR